MDNDLISRSALMEQLLRKRPEPASMRYADGFNDAILRVRSMVHSAPAVDAVPVVHARWKHSASNDRAYDYCSACGCGTMRRTYGYNPDGRECVTEQSYSYCPRCGARMDEKETDNG